MKDLNYISHEISKGKNLKENLKKYATGMASLYNGLAFMKLSMNDYTVYDILQENNATEAKFAELYQKFHQIVKNQILDEQHKCDITAIEELRNEVIHIMEVVTDYVDCFRIYEYVLNRVEYRFTENTVDREYYGMYFTNDLMHYILSDKDNIVINSKISEVVGQLPMRLSKNKFYEYVQEAFTLYHGAQKGTIDEFYMNLSSSAMLSKHEQFDTMFEEANDIYKTLSNADYTQLDEAEYHRLKGALDIATEKMSSVADLFVLLAQMVNDVYTILLTEELALDTDNVREVQTSKTILSEILAANDGEISEETINRFTLFEGKLERIMMAVTESDYAVGAALQTCQKELEENDLVTGYQNLKSVLLLQSGSDFVSLYQNVESEQVPDDTYADQMAQKLIAQLDVLFKGMPQMVRRAVMSAVISQLPVFFNNTEEIQSYINVSLEQCNDEAEQQAVIDILKSLMQED